MQFSVNVLSNELYIFNKKSRHTVTCVSAIVLSKCLVVVIKSCLDVAECVDDLRSRVSISDNLELLTVVKVSVED